MPNHSQKESQILDAEGLELTTSTRKPGIDKLSDAQLADTINTLKTRTADAPTEGAAAEATGFFRSALRRAMEERRARAAGKPAAARPARTAKPAATRPAKGRGTAASRRTAARTATPVKAARSTSADTAIGLSEADAPASAMIAKTSDISDGRATEADAPASTSIGAKKAKAAAVTDKLEKRIAKAEAKAREKVIAKHKAKTDKKDAKAAKAAKSAKADKKSAATDGKGAKAKG